MSCNGRGEMASRPMMMEQGSFDWRQLRPAAPLLFLPAGILFCLAHGLVTDGKLYGFEGMFNWSVLVHSPWVVAAFLFERSVRTGDTRRKLLLRAGAMALGAYAVSSCASFWLGRGSKTRSYRGSH